MKVMIILVLWTIICFLILLSTKKYERKMWNKGACPECNKGFFKSFDVASDNSVGYKCTHCNNYSGKPIKTSLKRCPRCRSQLLIEGNHVWCTFVGGGSIKACAFSIDSPVLLIELMRGSAK